MLQAQETNTRNLSGGVAIGLGWSDGLSDVKPDLNTRYYFGLYFLVTERTRASTPSLVGFYCVLAAAESLYLC